VAINIEIRHTLARTKAITANQAYAVWIEPSGNKAFSPAIRVASVDVAVVVAVAAEMSCAPQLVMARQFAVTKNQ